jgi:hypothetical protein
MLPRLVNATRPSVSVTLRPTYESERSEGAPRIYWLSPFFPERSALTTSAKLFWFSPRTLFHLSGCPNAHACHIVPGHRADGPREERKNGTAATVAAAAAWNNKQEPTANGPSPPHMTPTEHCRVELKIPNDPRAIGAVIGALQHTARHLGFPPNEEEELIALSGRLLRAGFDSLSSDATISVLIQEHANRIEIEFVRPAAAEKWVPVTPLPGIDQIEEEITNGNTHLRLIKFLPSPPEVSPTIN